LLIASACSVALLTGTTTVSARTQEAPAAEEESSPCAGIASGALAGTLSAVPRYGSSYILVVPERHAATVTGPASPELRGLRIGIHAGTAAAQVARALGLTNLQEYSWDESSPFKPLQDVNAGTTDAAILWGPLAGFGVLELGIAEQVSLYTLDRPRPAPASLLTTATPNDCSSAILDELSVAGALPAELLVSVDIRSMLKERAPEFSLAEAENGGLAYAEFCSQCHGPSAVADPKGLAPVDLRVSVRRFSYPGFHYIVLNGRPTRSMPPLRGTVTNEQIGRIYLYLKARSEKLLNEAQEAP
jgi:mono/diheme cytochrome c family protein